MTNETFRPPVLWAQEREHVFLTIDIESKDPEIKIEKSSVYFKGVNVRDNKVYEVSIPLHSDVIPEKSNFVNKGRCTEIVLQKENTTSRFWPSLLSDGKKPHYLKIDFNKWRDEDDEEVEESGGDSLDLTSMLQAMGGNKGSGDKKPSFDDLESDSDDENLPDLE